MITFAGPVEVRMGSPHHEEGRLSNEVSHRRRIGRSFAVASKAVTVEQWQQFVKDQPTSRQSALTPFGAAYPEAGVPVQWVSWFAAAQYCNWLSAKEGIPKEQWCYPEKIDVGMRMAPGWHTPTPPPSAAESPSCPGSRAPSACPRRSSRGSTTAPSGCPPSR